MENISFQGYLIRIPKILILVRWIWGDVYKSRTSSQFGQIQAFIYLSRCVGSVFEVRQRVGDGPPRHQGLFWSVGALSLHGHCELRALRALLICWTDMGTCWILCLRNQNSYSSSSSIWRTGERENVQRRHNCALQEVNRRTKKPDYR